MLNKLWYVFGTLCVLYFIGIAIFTGLANRFHIFWLILGAICIIIGKIPNKLVLVAGLPLIIKILFMVILLTICIIEGLIISGFVDDPPEDLDYVIVLGAQVKKAGPSRILIQRTKAACEYLMENPDTIMVVSGGQGYNEPMSEALAMKNYVLSHYDIPESRIIMEDQSTSTAENIAFSKKLVPLDAKVGIVTSNFHAYRAGKIARKAGFTNVSTIPAFSELPLLPSNMVREGMAVFKDWLVRNI
ncbi:conserved membrane protein of SANA family [Lachnospiraceae bacterium TWA4]|nr:conserved membrane protein of SANA family [Lachnospiraceae bacterium TWA4]